MYSFNKNACPLLCYDDNPNRIGLEHGAISHPWIHAFQVRHINIYVQCVKKKKTTKLKMRNVCYRYMCLNHLKNSQKITPKTHSKSTEKPYSFTLQFTKYEI